MTRPPPLRRLFVIACASTALLVGVAAAPAALAGAAMGEPGGGPRATRLSATRTHGAFSDVPSNFWDATSIDYVASRHSWMRDFGLSRFRPSATETRAQFARALVRAFAPTAQPGTSTHFKDLPDGDPFYPFAAVAVQKGWIKVHNGFFQPQAPVYEAVLHRALLFALGLRSVVKGLNQIHTADGYRLKHKNSFAPLSLGMTLGFRYNHADESMDVGPTDPLPRSEVAYSLYQASTIDEWKLTAAAAYRTIQLPRLSARRKAVVEYGMRWVGYPYVWGGEWYTQTPPGYPYGYQPHGGFDCSGFSWFVLRRAASGWSPPGRPYSGWSLPQRTSTDMAATGGKVSFANALPGDLMLFNDGGAINHVDVYMGNGWSLDSSSGYGGVSVVSLASGSWYRQHFAHARDIIR